MTDHDALLRAICENPRDDLPRLVFADYLEENGQPERAQFIRRDVEMYQRPEWDAERIRYERDEKPRQESAPWLQTFAALKVSWCDWGRPLFRRGFPWSLQIRDPRSLLAGWAEVTRGYPVERLVFHHFGPNFGQLAVAPWLGKLTGIGLHGDDMIRPDEFTSLGDSLATSGVEYLSLGFRWLLGMGVETLLQSPLFRNLCEIAFQNLTPSRGIAFFEGLEHQPPGPRFRVLTLDHAQLGQNGFWAFACANSLACLERLEITNSGIGVDRLRLFISLPTFRNLRILNLSNNHLGNAGSAAVANAQFLTNLLVLKLNYCQVGDDGIRAILDSPLAERLVLLDLTGSPASDEMKQALKERMGDRVRV